MKDNEFAFIEYIPDSSVYPTYESLPEYNNWLDPRGIKGYRLVNRCGEIVELSAKEAKYHFDYGDITIININKINETKSVQRSAKFNGVFQILNSLPDTVCPAHQKIVYNYIQKAREMGMEVSKRKVRTGCGHYCPVTLFKHKQGDIIDAIVEVPLNVMFLNLSERPLVFSSGLRKYGINGTVKFIGGTNVVHCIRMLDYLYTCKRIDLTDFTVENKLALKLCLCGFSKASQAPGHGCEVLV